MSLTNWKINQNLLEQALKESGLTNSLKLVADVLKEKSKIYKFVGKSKELEQSNLMIDIIENYIKALETRQDCY